MEMFDMAGHLIRRLNQISTQIFVKRTREAGFDLTPVQFAAMNVLLDNPGIDQARISALIAYDRATIGGVIDRLQQKGFVTRTINSRDRRSREVSLSPEGQRTIKTLLPIVQSLQNDILSNLSETEKASFIKLAAKAAKQ